MKSSRAKIYGNKVAFNIKLCNSWGWLARDFHLRTLPWNPKFEKVDVKGQNWIQVKIL